MAFARKPQSAKRGQMIARIWRGWAPQAIAGDYQRYYESEVSSQLQGVDGFCGAPATQRRRTGGHVHLSHILDQY